MIEPKKQLTEEEIEKKALADSIKNYYDKRGIKESESNVATGKIPPKIGIQSPEDFQSKMQKETDQDLIIDVESVELPSKGMFYPDGLSEVKVEYLTSKDEDIITTPSLIDDNKVIDVLLKRKIKTPNVDVSKLLGGDRSAVILFLRASSYGHEYEVEVNDPRTGVPFKEKVNLLKFKHKNIEKKPDEKGEFFVEIPMRKKIVKFKLLNSGEEKFVQQQAKAYQEAYGLEYSEYNTMKLKANITEINGNRDRSYIERFVDAMPALDAFTIKKEIVEVTPEFDMTYEFTASDGYKFKAYLIIGPDFFFPSL